MKVRIPITLVGLLVVVGWLSFRMAQQPNNVAVAADEKALPELAQVVEAKEPVKPGKVITRLVGRKQTITIRSSSQGPVYSVETVDGKVLASNVTLEDLRVSNPELYQNIQPLLAAEKGYMWAGK